MSKVLFERRFGLFDWLLGAAAFAAMSLVVLAIGVEVWRALAILWGFAAALAIAFAVLGEIALRREIAVLAESEAGLEATTGSLFGRGRTLDLAADDAKGWHYDTLWPGHPNWGPMQIYFEHEGLTYRMGLADARTVDREGLLRLVPGAFAETAPAG